MSERALVKRSKQPEVVTAAQVRSELIAARERAQTSLAVVESKLLSMTRWRTAVRNHPLLAIGGALAAGYFVGRWLVRR